MDRRFRRWAILIVAFLAICSSIGFAVKYTVKPIERGYGRSSSGPMRPNPTYTVTPAVEATTAPRRGGQGFQPATAPAAIYKNHFEPMIAKLQAAHARDATEIVKLFSLPRMLADWQRFGVAELPGRTIGSVEEEAIGSRLAARATKDTQTFRKSAVRVTHTAFSNSGLDAIVLAQHTITDGPRTETFFTRWWVTYESGLWKFYDYEEQPHRLRVNAILASYNTQSGPAAAQRTAEVVRRTTLMMQTGECPLEPLSPSMVVLADPLEVMQRALALADLRTGGRNAITKLENARQIWLDSPTISLMQASLSRNLELLGPYRRDAGDHPWATAIDAGIGGPGASTKAVRSRLEKALLANTGHPLLLAALRAHVPAAEYPALARAAAEGIAPSMAIRKLIEGQQPENVALMVEAFRKLRPGDPEACMAQAMLDVRGEQYAAGRAMLDKALAATALAERDDLKARFLNHCSTVMEREDLAGRAEFAPLFKK